MREDDFKSMMSKSLIKTSDDFTDQLMHRIEQEQEAKAVHKIPPFRIVFIICSILILIITFMLYKLFISHHGLATFSPNIPKTPIFIGFTLLLLYAMNHVIKVDEGFKSVSS